MQWLARPGLNIQDQIRNNQQQAFVDEEDEDEDYEEEEEKEEEQVRKRSRVSTHKQPTSKLDISPKKVNTSSLNTTTSSPLFSFVQEIQCPEIKEHFILIPYPAGLSVQVANPETEPQVALVQLEYKFKPGALKEICDDTGDNEARTSTFLETLKAEKKFMVPFVIDDIVPRLVEKENLLIIRIVGKKNRMVIDVK